MDQALLMFIRSKSIAEMRSIIEEASRAYEHECRRSAALVARLQETERQLADTKRQLTSAKQDANCGRREVRSLRATVRDLERRLAKSEEDGTPELDRLSLHVAVLETELEREETEHSRTRGRLDEAQSQVAALQLEVDRSGSAQTSDRGSLARLEARALVAEQRAEQYLGMVVAALAILDGVTCDDSDKAALRRQAARARMAKLTLSDEGRARVVQEARRLGVLPPTAEE